MRQRIGGGGIALGLSLLVLSGIGLFIPPGVPTQAQSASDIPGYDFVIRDSDVLENAIAVPQENFDLFSATRLVFETMKHADNRTFRIYENWIMWSIGLVYEPAARIRGVKRLVRGQSGYCSEAVLVLNHVATLNGRASRYVHLEGHVVAEVQTEQGWQVADPDFGLVFPMSIAELQSQRGIQQLRDELKRAGYGEDTTEEYVGALVTLEDNYVRAGDAPSSPRLYRLEMISEWMLWILPGVLLGVGLLLRRSI